MERHVVDRLPDLAAGTLDRAEGALAERHLAACSSCRSEWRRMTLARELGHADAGQLPPEVQAQIAAAVDDEEVRQAARRVRLAGGAIAAMAAFVVFFYFLRRPPDFVAAALDDHAAIQAGSLALELRTNDPAALEKWLAQRLPFQARVFDLRPMQYELVGGRLDDVSRRRSALFAHRGPRGDLVVCETFGGRIEELPPAGDTHTRDSRGFHVYPRDGTTIVFWQEGPLLYSLAGRGASGDILRLARSARSR